jgi:hypothetical protein
VDSVSLTIEWVAWIKDVSDSLKSGSIIPLEILWGVPVLICFPLWLNSKRTGDLVQSLRES